MEADTKGKYGKDLELHVSVPSVVNGEGEKKVNDTDINNGNNTAHPREGGDNKGGLGDDTIMDSGKGLELNNISEDKDGDKCTAGVGAGSEGNDNGLDDVAENDAEDKTNGATNSIVGRRGDDRMHKALAARIANPNLSLLEALKIGGFQFQNEMDDEGNGNSDKMIMDSDNVLLSQRKNQLSRRLRLAKKRPNSDADDLESLIGKTHGQAQIQVVASDEMDQQDNQTASIPSATYTNSNNQQQQGLKRPHDGTGEQQPPAGSNERSQPGHMYDQQQQISALQGQIGLQQNQGYFNGNQFMNMQQPGFVNPFIVGQMPFSYGNFLLQSQGVNGASCQSGQSPLDRYLMMAASSMGTSMQQILLAQSNLQGNMTSQQQSTHTQTSASNGLQNKNESEEDGSNVAQKNDPELIRRKEQQLANAVTFFSKEKRSLQSRCLTMAGFSEQDLKNKPEILIDFEELLREQNI